MTAHFYIGISPIEQKDFTFGWFDTTFLRAQGEFMVVGFFLICLGTLFILNNLGLLYGGVNRYVLPILLIAMGVSIVFKKIRGSSSGN